MKIFTRAFSLSLAFILLLSAGLSACKTQVWPSNSVSMEHEDSRDWPELGYSFRGERFSPLTQITQSNAGKLGFAWEYEARSHRGRVEHGQEATPIVVNGVLYASGPWGSVFAVDARTGKEKWRYDPDVDGSYGRRTCCDVVNRGLQVARGKVYVGTLDGHLVALSSSTGKELWKVDTLIDRKRFYTITSPPKVAKDVVVIGNSGADFGVRGYITAYDLETGKERWRFFTVPHDPNKGAQEHAELNTALKSWGPKTDWESGLGGTAWGEMNYDPELGFLYVGTGNSAPYSGWHRDPSRKDNLYLASILALDPDTGRLVWHYQTTPWELWDYTATANMILAELEIRGRTRKVLMQAPKNGFFYVIDRVTGEFISADPYVYTNWAKKYDSSGRPVLTGKALYEKKPAVIFPNQVGAHNWQPMAFNPRTGLVYIPAREQGMVMMDAPDYKYTPGDLNTGSVGILVAPAAFLTAEERELITAQVSPNSSRTLVGTRETLIAWDPVARKARWKKLIGTTDYAGGGVLTTAGGLVFQGLSSGHLIVYRADNGEKIGDIETGTAIMAAPITYELDGEQYVAVMAGFGGFPAGAYPEHIAAYTYKNYGRILAFKIGGAKTPLPPRRVEAEVEKPVMLKFVTNERAARGLKVFNARCVRCHGGQGEDQLSAYPDLFRLSPATHQIFESVVLGGVLSSAGMASFSDVLGPEDVRGIQSYLLLQQKEMWESSRVGR